MLHRRPFGKLLDIRQLVPAHDHVTHGAIEETAHGPLEMDQHLAFGYPLQNAEDGQRIGRVPLREMVLLPAASALAHWQEQRETVGVDDPESHEDGQQINCLGPTHGAPWRQLPASTDQVLGQRLGKARNERFAVPDQASFVDHRQRFVHGQPADPGKPLPGPLGQNHFTADVTVRRIDHLPGPVGETGILGDPVEDQFRPSLHALHVRGKEVVVRQYQSRLLEENVDRKVAEGPVIGVENPPCRHFVERGFPVEQC